MMPLMITFFFDRGLWTQCCVSLLLSAYGTRTKFSKDAGFSSVHFNLLDLNELTAIDKGLLFHFVWLLQMSQQILRRRM